MIRSIVICIALLGLCSTITACAITPLQAVQGQIIDQENGKPVAGAIVAGLWNATVSHVVESASVCYHVDTATTDADGRFLLPATELERRYMEGDHDIDVYAYKVGYEYVRRDRGKGIIYFKPFKGAVGERIKYLLHLSGLVSCYGVDEKSTFLLQKMLYTEARGIAVTDIDKDSALNIRHSAALVWSPSERTLTDAEIETLINNSDYLREQLQ